MINYLKPDHEAVEESQLNRWRVFNGQDWTHGFTDKEQAIQFAKKNGGSFMAFCQKMDGQVVYTSLVKLGVKINDKSR